MNRIKNNSPLIIGICLLLLIVYFGVFTLSISQWLKGKQNPLASFTVLGACEQLINQKKSDEAIVKLDEYLKKQGESARVYQLRSKANFVREQFEPAFEDLKKALDLEPQNGALYYDLARIYGRTGETQKLNDAIDQAIQYDPTNPRAYNFRAMIHLGPIYNDPPFEIEPEQMEQYKLALADYTQAITLNPRDFTAHMGIVDAYYLMLEFNTALQKLDYIIANQDKHAFDGRMRNIEVVRERIVKAKEGYEKYLGEKGE